MSWPRGKRRHADQGDWTAVQAQLQALFGTVASTLVSRRTAAREIGVSEKTLRRWLSGQHRPDQIGQDRVLAWITRTRRRLGLAGLPLSPLESRVIGRSEEEAAVSAQGI